MVCARFQPSNVHAEPQLECEIGTDRSDLLIREFSDKMTDVIIDVRVCDVSD